MSIGPNLFSSIQFLPNGLLIPVHCANLLLLILWLQAKCKVDDT